MILKGPTPYVQSLSDNGDQVACFVNVVGVNNSASIRGRQIFFLRESILYKSMCTHLWGNVEGEHVISCLWSFSFDSYRSRWLLNYSTRTFESLFGNGGKKVCTIDVVDNNYNTILCG